MPTKPSPLLCELHAHTTWSDGALDMRRLCDLYGQSGFDVLAITDHVTRAGDHVNALRFDAYLSEIEREAARAVRLYGLIVLPGLELTYDDPDPLRAGHAVAVGLRSFVDVADGLEAALAAARAPVGALAAHPIRPITWTARPARRRRSRRGPSSPPSSTGSSSSTAKRSSTGSQPPGSRGSPTAISTGSSISAGGRR